VQKLQSSPAKDAAGCLNTQHDKTDDDEKKKEILLQFIKQVLHEKQALKAAKAVWSFFFGKLAAACPADFGTNQNDVCISVICIT